MTDFPIPRPTRGDIIELILDDHRIFEDLLRACRRDDLDRGAARSALAEILIAHAESEEAEAYDVFERKDAITPHEEEHGEQEHAEIIEALLGFLDAKGTDTQKYEDALEELAEKVNHHSSEEELTILNPARADLSEQVRADLGAKWLAKRNALLEQGCASRDQVAALLEQAVREKVIPPEQVRAEMEQIEQDAKEEAKALEEDAIG